MALTKEDIGIFEIVITLIDLNPLSPKENIYSLTITVTNTTYEENSNIGDMLLNNTDLDPFDEYNIDND